MSSDYRGAKLEEFNTASFPLPLAQTLRRAINAKSPGDRHQAAYYFFESLLKLSAAAQISQYLWLGSSDRVVDKSLMNLIQPSVGHWWEVLRVTAAVAARRKDASLLPLAGVSERLNRTGSHQAIQEFLQFSAKFHKTTESRKKHSVFQLFDALVHYRNTLIGHGAQQPWEVYAEAGPLLLDAVLEAYAILLPFADLKLVLARDILHPKTKQAVRQLCILRGDGLHSPIKDQGSEANRAIAAGQLAFLAPNHLLTLYPLVWYSEDSLEHDTVSFFNGLNLRLHNIGETTKLVVKNVRYLDYASGECLSPEDAGPALETFFARFTDYGNTLPVLVPEASGVDTFQTADLEVKDEGNFLGDFRLLTELGGNGVEVIYQALQSSLDRVIALKILPPSRTVDPVSLARFKRETTALARCDHPNVIKVLSAGQVRGVHYLAMEFVQGSSLAEVLKVLQDWRQESGNRFYRGHLQHAAATAATRNYQATLTNQGKADSVQSAPAPLSTLPMLLETGTENDYDKKLTAIMSQACHGVHHLHERGLIHRNLKPSNLMLTADGSRLVVMDPGIAHQIGMDSNPTAVDARAPNPLRYLPPEQVNRNLGDVDERADVYALGAILYELACFAPFLDGDTEPRLIQQILQENPIPPRVHSPAIPTDLETIIQTATQKLPQDRYPSAQAMAEDLAAFARGEPIRTRNPGLKRQIQLLYSRNRQQLRIGFAVAAVAFVIIATVIAGFIIHLRGVNRSLEQQRREAELSLAKSTVLLGDSSSLANDWVEAWRQYKTAYNLFTANDSSPFTAELGLNQLLATSPVGVFASQRDYLDLAITPDGRTIVAANQDSGIDIVDGLTGRTIRTLYAHEHRINSVVFSPDSRYLLSGSADGSLKITDVLSGTQVALLQGHDAAVYCAAFSPDGALIVSADQKGIVKVWRIAAAEELKSLVVDEGAIYQVSFSSDASQVLTANQMGSITLWDINSNHVMTLYGHEGSVYCAVFSPDSKRIVSGSHDRTIKLWSVETGTEIMTMTGHKDYVKALAFTADGARILSGGNEAVVKTWDAITGNAITTFWCPSERARSIAFSNDGRFAAAEGTNEFLYTWNIGDSIARSNTPNSYADCQLAPDAKTYVVCGQDCGFALYDVATDQKLAEFNEHNSPTLALAFSPCGKLIVSGETSGALRLWNLHTGAEVLKLDSRTILIEALAFSPCGKYFVSAGQDFLPRVWEVATGELTATLEGHSAAITGLGFSSDSSLICCASMDGTISIQDRTSQRDKVVFNAHRDGVTDATFLPSNGPLLACGADGLVTLWDTQQLRSFRGHAGVAYSVGSTLQGRLIISSGSDRSVRIWETESGELVRTFADHPDAVVGVEIADTGTVIVARRRDATTTKILLHAGSLILDWERFFACLPGTAFPPNYLSFLTNWYYYRALPAWALDVYNAIPGKGSPELPHLLLARCFWQQGQAKLAAQEFHNALAATEEDELYLRLCLQGVVRDGSTPPP